MPRSIKQAFAIVALTLAYLALARVGLGFSFTIGHVAPYWPAGGLAVGALAAFGGWLAPAVFAGQFVNALMAHNPWPCAFGLGLGSMLEAWGGAWLLRRLLESKSWRGVSRVVAAVSWSAAAASCWLPPVP